MSKKEAESDPKINIDHSKGRAGISISVKILAVTLGTTILVLLVSGIISFIMSRDSIESKIFDQLTSVREIKGQQIESYAKTINGQIKTLSSSPTIIDAMRRFRLNFRHQLTRAQSEAVPGADPHLGLLAYYQQEFFGRLRPNTPNKLKDIPVSQFIPKHPGSIEFQETYISNNPYPTGEKHRLDSSDGSLYGNLHQKYHPFIRQYLEEFGFYDIFLIDHETGHIVYSVFKEVDFATSLKTGPYKDTNFAEAFLAASESDDKNFVKLVDFRPYYPSYNAPASFIASPIFENNKKIGVLVFQMPIDRLNDIMTSNHAWKDVGLGDSGETYIVGNDFTMRNQSRFLIEDPDNFLEVIRNTDISEKTIKLIENFGSTIGLLPIKTDGAKAALDGQTGMGTIFPDYRGVSVLSSYSPLDIQGVNWAIMSEIDESEAFAPIEKLKDRIILSASALIAIAIYFAFFFSRSMTANLSVLTTRAEALARGELDEPITVKSKDEIGQLAYGFEKMRKSIRKLVDDLHDEKATLEGRVTSRTAKLDVALHKQEEQTEALVARNKEMLDIQKELEQSGIEQKASKDRIDSILQASPDGICVINTKGIIQMANQSMLKIFDYELDEVLGNRVNMLMYDEVSSEHDHYLERIVWGREPKLIGKGAREVEGRKKDGSSFPLDLSVSIIGSGKDALFVGILRDITERIAMERQAKEQAAFQAALLDAVPNPIFVKDLNLRYTAFNRAYEEAFGMRREDFIGKTVLDADYIAESQEGYHESDRELIEKGGFTRDQYAAKFADGEEHEVLYWRRTFNLSDGKPGGMLGLLIDISDRKQMEREMAAAQEQAETANKTKSEFLANMSHELRTPMNAIIGYGEMLIEDAEDEGQDDMIPDLDKIVTAGKHLLQLINDVLDISKVEAGHMDMYLEEFDIAEMIENAASTVTTLVEKNNNVLDIQVQENIGSMHADMTKVRQMVFNLVSNAAKFTSDGTVGIQAGTMEKEGKPFIRLAVTDTGIGIPEDKLDHIFEEFTQADSSTTRNYGGTGLGLALVRRFAIMMGGDVRVESTMGEGSAFILEIPAHVIDADSKIAAENKAVDGDAEVATTSIRKILVIDDDDTARRLVTRHLESEGYTVISTDDGARGIELAKSEKPAAITCDILMPNVDGWDVLKALKADPETRSIPIIMVSMVDDDKKGLALGAAEHLRKPISRELLQEAIAKYVKASGKVLVVEDDPATQDVISKALKAVDITTLLANNGQEALDILKDDWPDLVLLDLMMPVMDGFEFLSYFRELDGSDKVPVIVVTAKDLTTRERKDLGSRVAGVVAKEENYLEDLVHNVSMVVGKPNPSISDREKS
jgi:PAS domain S-box-containing protein